MTHFQVRTQIDQAVDPSADVLLDWFNGDRPQSTVKYEPAFLRGLAPSPVAQDLLRLGGAVFCTDKLAHRSNSVDLWTRELTLAVPVSDVDVWTTASTAVHEALTFLTGDHWDVRFVALPPNANAVQESIPIHHGVSLFSGGLDSLAGVIDLLDAGHNLVLVGHHDSPLTDNRQRLLASRLQQHFGDGRAALRRLYLRPADPRPTQARPLPHGTPEQTTRGRSFLFLAAGIAIANSIGPGTPLYVPENGFIGVNVPLTSARTGSLSTRTTHPYFIDRMGAMLSALSLDHAIENPFRLLTKGELLQQSRNRRLLESLAEDSISCSHPELARLRHRGQGNCGYCYPCLIRRASLHAVGQDRTTDYSWDALTDESLLKAGSDSGSSLRALLASLAQPERRIDVLRNGRIPNGEADAFYDLYRRGRGELRRWLDHGAGPEVRARLVD